MHPFFVCCCACVHTDHVEAVAGLNTRFARTRTSNSLKVPRCLALITTGVPPTHQLYNGSMCSPSGGSLLKPFQQVIMEGNQGGMRCLRVRRFASSHGDYLFPPLVSGGGREAENTDILCSTQALRSSKPKRGFPHPPPHPPLAGQQEGIRCSVPCQQVSGIGRGSLVASGGSLSVVLCFCWQWYRVFERA